MKIKIYQNDKETYFWNVNDIDEITKICPEFIHRKNLDEPYELNFLWNDYEIIIARNYRHDFIEGNYDFIKGVNIIVVTNYIEYWFNQTTIDRLINFGSDYKFIIVSKNIEDYWINPDSRYNDSFFNMISVSGNIKVIYDSCFVKQPNFFFEPKVHIQNYYNNDHFMGSLFLNGFDIFYKIKDKKRIGIHFNKLSDKIRLSIANNFKNYNHNNLLFTINKECVYNEKNNLTMPEIKSPEGLYSPHLFSNTLPSEFYIEQFTNLTIKSHIEIVYETFTTVSVTINCIKWNEKTIKHLFLGKPFIHMDPVAHKLMEINGFIPYRSLFNNELWDMYENTDPKELLFYKEVNWSDLLTSNIKWLLDMDESEWNERLNEANRIAEINRNKAHDLIFNTSLLKYVELGW